MSYFRKEKLKYTKACVDVLVYDSGLELYRDVDWYYEGESFRDKAIVKFDVIQFLTEYYEPKNLEEYREAIFYLATGKETNPEKLSELILEMAKVDSVFASRLNEFYYTCDIGTSFGEYIVQSIADAINCYYGWYQSFFRGKTESVICLSGGYLYICVPDTGMPIYMDREFKYEVLSDVKNWNGKFTIN